MKDEYGGGLSTIVGICNETGSSAKLTKSHTWNGKVWKYPIAPCIASGQRAACLHVQVSESETGSEGAIVYRVKNGDDKEFDVFLGWSTPGGGSNKVLVECRDVDHWWASGSESYMLELIEKSDTISTDLGTNGIDVIGSIGQSVSPVVSIFIGVV